MTKVQKHLNEQPKNSNRTTCDSRQYLNIIEVTLMSAYGSAAQVLSDEEQVLDADGYTFAYQLASNVNVDSQLTTPSYW